MRDAAPSWCSLVMTDEYLCTGRAYRNDCRVSKQVGAFRVQCYILSYLLLILNKITNCYVFYKINQSEHPLEIYIEHLTHYQYHSCMNTEF